jgi:hypothetical protein
VVFLFAGRGYCGVAVKNAERFGRAALLHRYFPATPSKHTILAGTIAGS